MTERLKVESRARRGGAKDSRKKIEGKESTRDGARVRLVGKVYVSMTGKPELGKEGRAARRLGKQAKRTPAENDDGKIRCLSPGKTVKKQQRRTKAHKKKRSTHCKPARGASEGCKKKEKKRI